MSRLTSAVRPAYLLAVLLCLALSACSSGSGGDTADLQELLVPVEGAPADSLPGGLPAFPVDDRQASVTALTSVGKDYYDSSPGVQVSGDRLVLASSPSVMRWSIYRFSSTETAAYPVELRVEVGDNGDPYWLAMANYAEGNWQFTGPFSGYGTFAVPNDGDFVSPEGYAYAAAITYNGNRAVIDELELVLSQFPPPPAPKNLEASVQPGSVRLEWDATITPGLVGYNVYFALSEFTLPEQFFVSRANLSLVPATAEPSYNVTELEADTNYYFRVAAVVGDQVESPLSNQAITSTTYSLSATDIFPQRQYPGFWVYLEGSGFNPEPGATVISINSTPIPADHVAVVNGNELRFRVPKNRPTEESCLVRVHNGAQASNTIPLFVTNYETPPKTWAHIGRTLYQQYQMYEPYGVAVDPAGHVWISSTQANRVDGFTENGQPYKTVFINDIRDIEALADGKLLLKEGSGSQIWLYNPQDGHIVRAVDDTLLDPLIEDCEFIAASADGNTIYFSDEGAGLIHKFVGGAFSLSFGEAQLDAPRDIEINGEGNLVVVDAALDKVVWLSPSGTFIDEYDGSADVEGNAGELRDPYGVAVAGNLVYVADRERDRVLRLNNANHSFLGEWGESGYQDGSTTGLPEPLGAEAHFWALWGLAANADGDIIATDNFNMRAGLFRAADGMFLTGMGDYVVDAGEFIYPRSVGVRESDGAYVVLDRAAFTLTTFDRENNLLGVEYLETNGDENESDVFTGRMGRHGENIVWSSNERIYFTHAYNKLTEYSEDFAAYRLLAYDWGEEPTEFKGAYSLCELNGELYISDRDNARIQVFSALGNYVRDIDMPDPANQRPDRVAMDKENGWLYVLDRAWNNQTQVHRFDALTGDYLDSLSPGYGMGALLAVDPVGHIYVYHNDDGFLLERWAPPASVGGAYDLVDRFLTWGDGDGEVRSPESMTISPDGRYFICDRDRQQLVVLAP